MTSADAIPDEGYTRDQDEDQPQRPSSLLTTLNLGSLETYNYPYSFAQHPSSDASSAVTAAPVAYHNTTHRTPPGSFSGLSSHTYAASQPTTMGPYSEEMWLQPLQMAPNPQPYLAAPTYSVDETFDEHPAGGPRPSAAPAGFGLPAHLGSAHASRPLRPMEQSRGLATIADSVIHITASYDVLDVSQGRRHAAMPPTPPMPRPLSSPVEPSLGHHTSAGLPVQTYEQVNIDQWIAASKKLVYEEILNSNAMPSNNQMILKDKLTAAARLLNYDVETLQADRKKWKKAMKPVGDALSHLRHIFKDAAEALVLDIYPLRLPEDQIGIRSVKDYRMEKVAELLHNEEYLHRSGSERGWFSHPAISHVIHRALYEKLDNNLGHVYIKHGIPSATMALAAVSLNFALKAYKDDGCHVARNFSMDAMRPLYEKFLLDIRNIQRDETEREDYEKICLLIHLCGLDNRYAN
ncbi:hypothetical protein LshimejAT787_0405200 [Lyophyllum shimeji]|uniref:DUF6532 domain-containing protein n=1 Tax=Lyophyllum shimeji TaxID=47721 RepID=A0A9P3PL80_LYOSH|nr:hypothetical protein LshimejAT787_0405200 [Lyophyllum shimeji]